MKRVLFLLLVTVSALSVSAQKDYRSNRPEQRYHYKYEKKKHLRSNEEYRRQVASINHQFDQRIHSIRKNPFMSRNQKNRKVGELEMHRRIALNECRDRFITKDRRDYARERKYNNRRW